MGRILIVDFDEPEIGVFDEVKKLLQKHSGFTHLQVTDSKKLSVPGLDIYPDLHQVYRDCKNIRLTAKEYAILCLLMENRGCVLTYDQIYQKVWHEDALGNANNAIKCHVRNLRKKLYKPESNPSFAIRCVREVGYCFEIKTEVKSDT